MKILTKLIVFLFLIFTSCGGSGGGGTTSEKETEKIRFINVVKQVSSINIQLGNDLFIEELPYGESTNFIEASEGEQIPISVTSFEQVLPILTGEQEIESGTKKTYILYDEARVVSLLEIDEAPVKPLPTESSVRFLNLSEKQNSVDIYLLLPGAEIENLEPATSALGFNGASEYFSFPSGTYDIVYTVSGSTKILRRTNSLSFSENRIYTHVLLDQIGPITGQSSRLFEDLVF